MSRSIVSLITSPSGLRPAAHAPRDRFPVGTRVRVGVTNNSGGTPTPGRRGAVVETYDHERRVEVDGRLEWYRADALVEDKTVARRRRRWNGASR